MMSWYYTDFFKILLKVGIVLFVSFVVQMIFVFDD